MKEENKKYCTNPIIIGGSGSSGSTLLKSLLNRHSKIAIGPELSLFNKNMFFETPFEKIKDNINTILEDGMCTDGWFLYPTTFSDFEKYGWSKTYLIKMTLSKESHKDFIDDFMGVFLDKSQKNLWAEKTPANSYCFNEFNNIYPNARFIHLYRDGKDVVTSLIKRGMSPYYATMMWLYNTSTASKYKNKSNYFEIKYESLVNNPKEILEDLLSFLNLDYEPTIFTKNDYETDKITSWNNSPTGKISSGSIGSHKNMDNYSKYVFNNTIINKIHANNKNITYRSTQDLLELFGYDLFDYKFNKLEKLYFHSKLIISYARDLKSRYFTYRKCYNKNKYYPGGIK